MEPIRIYPGQPLGLPFNMAQRKRLCKAVSLEDAFVERIRNVAPDKPEIPFTLAELRRLLGQAGEEAKTIDDPDDLRLLADICERIAGGLGCHVEDETVTLTDDEDPEHELSPSEQPFQLEEYAPDRLSSFADTLEPVCESAGLDFDAVLEHMQPTQIEPDDEVGLFISPREKQMLLGLDRLDGDIKDTLRSAPKSKRKFTLPFSQIGMIEEAVTVEIDFSVDRDEQKRWDKLHGKLAYVQAEYTTHDGFEDALLQALAGDTSAKSAAASHLLAKLIERRKADRITDE